LKDDEKINNKKDRRRLFKLDEFIDTVSGAESGVAIIDTCRSNLSIKKNQKGFVPILSKSDTVILTASKFGQTASDEEEGILTKSLLKVIKEDISLLEVFKRTQKYVFLESKYQQSPTVINLDKVSSIYLGGRKTRPNIPTSRPPTPTSRPPIDEGHLHREDISIKSHGYTFISTISDIEELRNMNTYVFLPDNISSQNNRKSKKYKRYEKVLELIQEAPKYDINITSLGTKAKEINRFILMNKKSNEKKITVESYNYDLANDIVNHIQNEAECFLERRWEREGKWWFERMLLSHKLLGGDGPYLLTTTQNIFRIRNRREFLFIDLSTFNDSAIKEIIRTYKQHLIDDGNVGFSDFQKFRHKVLSLITNLNSNIKTMHKVVAGEL